MSLQNEKPIEEQNGLTEREWWIIAVLLLFATASVYISYAHKIANADSAKVEIGTSTSIPDTTEDGNSAITKIKQELDEAKRLYNDSLQKLWHTEDENKRLTKENENWRNRVAELEKQIRENRE